MTILMAPIVMMGTFRLIDSFRELNTFREITIFLENGNAAAESGEKHRISSMLYVLSFFLSDCIINSPISLVLLKHNQLKCSRLS